jgi:hypothetical protein
MKKVFEVIEQLKREGVVEDYAVAGTRMSQEVFCAIKTKPKK